MRKEAEYAYAIGRIRVLEKGLLDGDKINRMIEAKSVKEAFAALNDSVYGKWISEAGSSFDYDKVINSMLKETYDVLKAISPDSDVLKIFLAKYDFHNIKVILKSMFLDTDADDLLVDICSVPVDILKQEINERNYEKAPAYFVEAITGAIEKFNISKDPQEIDIVLDKAMFDFMIKTAKKLKYDFLIELVEFYVDFYNIKTFLRIISKDNKQKYIDNALIDGGTLEFEGKLEKATLEQFVDYLRDSKYKWLVTTEDSLNWVDLERNMDNAIVNFVRKKKYTPLGIEPFVGYLLAKEMEARVVRVIFAGKLNGFEQKDITERIRNLYV